MFYEKTEDVSARNKGLIGKNIVLKNDFFLVTWWGITKEIRIPPHPTPSSGFLPTYEQYTKNGDTWTGLCPEYRVYGIAQRGEKFKILYVKQVVGLLNNGLMHMYLLREKDKNQYETYSSDGIFSDNWDTGIFYLEDENVALEPGSTSTPIYTRQTSAKSISSGNISYPSRTATGNVRFGMTPEQVLANVDKTQKVISRSEDKIVTQGYDKIWDSDRRNIFIFKDGKLTDHENVSSSKQ